MTIAHNLLSGWLRFTGRHREADEIEAAASPSPALTEKSQATPAVAASPAPKMPAALVIHGGDRDLSHSSSAAAAPGPAPSSALSLAAGADAEHGSGTGDGGSSRASSGNADGAAAGSGVAPASTPAAAPTTVAETLQPADLHADPLAGIYSDRMRTRIERDAFAGASSTAQDSEIAREAARLQAGLAAALRPGTPPAPILMDTSCEAQAARIAALKGQIPDWARGDLENDPALVRARETARTQAAASAPVTRSASLVASPSAPTAASRSASVSATSQPRAGVRLRDTSAAPARASVRAPAPASPAASKPAPARGLDRER